MTAPEYADRFIKSPHKKREFATILCDFFKETIAILTRPNVSTSIDMMEIVKRQDEKFKAFLKIVNSQDAAVCSFRITGDPFDEILKESYPDIYEQYQLFKIHPGLVGTKSEN